MGGESNIFLFQIDLCIRAQFYWAGRSVVDRVIGIDEAADSISARSILFLKFVWSAFVMNSEFTRVVLETVRLCIYFEKNIDSTGILPIPILSHDERELGPGFFLGNGMWVLNSEFTEMSCFRFPEYGSLLCTTGSWWFIDYWLLTSSRFFQKTLCPIFFFFSDSWCIYILLERNRYHKSSSLPYLFHDERAGVIPFFQTGHDVSNQ